MLLKIRGGVYFMAFIKYRKDKPKKGISSKTIGITQRGRFAFYKPVFEKFLSDALFVELFYDPENNQIGIKPVKENTTDSFRIQGKTTKMIVAKKFLNRFNIPIEDRRYDFTFENGMLIVQI